MSSTTTTTSTATATSTTPAETATPKLFTPTTIGPYRLAHRVVLAPLTRYRADAAHVHGDLAREYYAQRASVPGTLLITEATFISPRAAGFKHVPGVWSEAQVEGWRKITDAVHARGCFIFMQLWALGRAAIPEVLEAEGGMPYVSASDVQMTGKDIPPRPLTVEEIKEYMSEYATAARNAIAAGFDGVELHSANGYLCDQFLQDVSNKRTDAYGGSVENRARFVLEALEAITGAVGAERVGIRVSPWGRFQDMRMDDPKPTFSHLVREIAARFPDMAYLHAVEPRVEGNRDRDVEQGESNDFLRELWAPRPYISAGGYGYKRELALQMAEEKGDIIAFGRSFISNPDLPKRLQKNIPLTPSNRDTYYTPLRPEGYVDYPFAADAEVEKVDVVVAAASA